MMAEKEPRFNPQPENQPEKPKAKVEEELLPGAIEKKSHGPLVPFEAGDAIDEKGYIKTLPSDPTKLVRYEILPEGSIEDATSYLSQLRKNWEYIKSHGVNVPEMKAIIGENEEGERCAFVFVDKIEGKTMGEIAKSGELSAEEKEKFEIFYTNILQSVSDAYKDGRPFLCDFLAEGNIMYGNKIGETKKDFFLVDVGDAFIENNKDDYYKEKFRKLIHGTSYVIKRHERVFGMKFDRIREKIEEVKEFVADRDAKPYKPEQ